MKARTHARLNPVWLFFANCAAVACVLMAIWSWLNLKQIAYPGSGCSQFFDFGSCSGTTTVHWEYMILSVVLLLAAIGIWFYLIVQSDFRDR